MRALSRLEDQPRRRVALGSGRRGDSPHLRTRVGADGMDYKGYNIAVHELGHNTVFRSTRLNEFFLHLFAFLDWHHVRKFQSSHQRHHRVTTLPQLLRGRPG